MVVDMFIDVIDKKIRKAFSNAALQYEVLTSLHNEIGRDLIHKIINMENCSFILDVGMGTGKFTNKLSFYFPESRVIGVDFASGMIEFAKAKMEGFQIIQADACALPFKENAFDIIVSNLSYQWVKRLPEALKLCYRTLKKGGTFCFTMFGYETLTELFASLEQSVNVGDRKIFSKIQRLASRNDILDAMHQAGFDDVDVDYEHIKVHFPKMMDLIKWIKDIGANALAKDLYVGKELLARANDYYNQNFRDKFGIYATFEVIWVEVQK